MKDAEIKAHNMVYIKYQCKEDYPVSSIWLILLGTAYIIEWIEHGRASLKE